MKRLRNTMKADLRPVLVVSQLVFCVSQCNAAEAGALNPQTVEAGAIQAGNAKPEAPVVEATETAVVKIVGSHSDTSQRRNETVAKITVSREEVMQYGDANLADALKRLPGITVGAGGNIQMRGLGNGYTQILLNGEPVPPGFSITSISPSTIERIEILRASTAEFSTQAVAGTINIILRKSTPARRKDIRIGGQYERSMWGGTGNFSLSDQLNAGSYTVTGAYVQARYDQAADIRTESADASGGLISAWDNAKRVTGTKRNLNLSPRINWTLGPDNVLTSQSFISFTTTTLDGSEDIQTREGEGPTFGKVRADANWRNGSARSDLIWNKRLANDGRIESKIGFSYFGLHNGTTSFQYAGSDLALDRIEDHRLQDFGLTVKSKYSIAIASKHQLAFGVDGSANVRDDKLVQQERLWQALRRKPVYVNDKNSVQINRLAAFAQDEWEITPRFSAYLGLRWEGIETKAESRNFVDATNRSSVWSPLAQFLWKLTERKNQQLRLAFTRTYKAPGLGNLVPNREFSVNNSPVDPDTQGNPALRPELATGVDAAYEAYFGKTGMFSASAYSRRISNVIMPVVTLVDGAWVSIPQNGGGARTHGIELEVKLPLRELIKDAPQLDLGANFTRNWSELDSVSGPYNRLSSQVPSSASVKMSYVMSPRLSLGGSYTIQTAGMVRLSASQFAYGSVTRLLDLYGVWVLRPGLQLRLSTSNTLAQDKIAESIYTDAAGTTRARTFTHASPLVRATLEMTF